MTTAAEKTAGAIAAELRARVAQLDPAAIHRSTYIEAENVATLLDAYEEMLVSLSDLLVLHRAHHNNPMHAAARAALARASDPAA